MANNIEFAPVYYDSEIAGEIAYKDYQQKIAMTRDITDSIANSTESINSAIVNAQIATSNAIYNNAQEIKGTLVEGFSGVSREIGAMGAQMSMGFAALNTAVQASSQAICDRLDTMNDILNNPSLTKTRELFRRAQVNYDKGFYEEARNDLLEALSSNKTDYISWFLLGKTYLFGGGEFSNVIDLDAAVDALKNAVKFITPDARKQNDARILASEMCFYLGLAQQTKAFDLLHAKNDADCKSFLEQAGGSYGQSYDYSAQMLEARYNRARCKALLGDAPGALADLETVILADRNYCIKVFADKDFSSITGQFPALVKKLKNVALIAAKKDYDLIKTMLSDLASLGGKSKVTVPAPCNEESPYFDILDYAKNLKRTISIVKYEKRAKYKACIALNLNHTFGLKADGTVVAAGDNSSGQCNVSSWRDIVGIAAGTLHTVGLKADGTVVAVGNNKTGQRNVSDWHDIVGIVAGSSHTVGLKADGTVVAAGDNKKGECNVSSWRDIVGIVADSFLTVGLKADGTVVAAGANESGQCNVSAWRDIVGIATEYNRTVGLKADGTVVAVGKNEDGQCNVSAWRDIVGITASDHTVCLKADGTVVAVGSNHLGQCNVSGWRDIVGISAGSFHTVGLKADGTVVAVGANESGQCNVSDWRDIGPVSEEKVKLFKERAKKEREAKQQQLREIERLLQESEIQQREKQRQREIQQREKQQREEQQRQQQQQWQAQGLCKYCGG